MTTRAKRSKHRPTPTQVRAARRARRRARRRLVRWGGGSLVGIVALAFIVALFLPGLNLSIGGTSAPSGPGVKFSDQGTAHVDVGQEHPPFNSVPATSGWHFQQPLAPVRWGVHDRFLADEYRLHNLEHGGIAIHYDCPEGCEELEDQLSDMVTRAVDGGLKVLMSPYPDMDTTIALTAWNFIDKFDVFDEERVKAFIDAHESSPNAPERAAR